MANFAFGFTTRLVALGLVATLAAAGAALAGGRTSAPAALVAASASAPATLPAVLAVPDVRGQRYVFAKSILEEHGFAWRVTGRVPGLATNVVQSQSPAPGLRVIDTGAPTIVLALARTDGASRGRAENASPYPGTPVRLLDPGSAS